MLGRDRSLAVEKIGFGGGCHWCTEGVFQSLKGVAQVDQGFIRSEAPSDAWAEGVIVHFDPAIITLPVLAEVHLRTHSAVGTYSPDGRYRSAIYVFDPGQHAEAAKSIAQFALAQDEIARTTVLPLVGFKPSDARYQNYYRTDPKRPFCRLYIDPKLQYIREHFSEIAVHNPTDCEP
jgi:peptide-methionine (S)-S-oxide reductase